MKPDGAVDELGRRDRICGPTSASCARSRLDLDPPLDCPRALAPLIDPNVHSCGTVRPHGAAELQQPESGLFIVGMKSYGRAPTFLLATGYEQVRSVAAFLAGISKRRAGSNSTRRRRACVAATWSSRISARVAVVRPRRMYRRCCVRDA